MTNAPPCVQVTGWLNPAALCARDRTVETLRWGTINVAEWLEREAYRLDDAWIEQGTGEEQGKLALFRPAANVHLLPEDDA
jgi:hypothetical protein